MKYVFILFYLSFKMNFYLGHRKKNGFAVGIDVEMALIFIYNMQQQVLHVVLNGMHQQRKLNINKNEITKINFNINKFNSKQMYLCNNQKISY